MSIHYNRYRKRAAGKPDSLFYYHQLDEKRM
uniref:Uncharacterized protein n=1 Tax=Myoviridae sp. ctagO6 TaxID=2826667 RepID=A0A8S5NNG1_9CAUD|nr:MAG TPA: hypothetical protein [Myoviridae sp. ctagO6]